MGNWIKSVQNFLIGCDCPMDFIDQQELFCDFFQTYWAHLKRAHIIAENNDDESILNPRSVGNNYKFYSLDTICQTRPLFIRSEINFIPKTIDAIRFKKCDGGFFCIYMIEFKGDKIKNRTSKAKFKEYLDDLEQKLQYAENDFERRDIQDIIDHIAPLYNKYSDSLLNSLVLKPLETVTTALPLIYKDYCNENNPDETFDIVDFLRNCKINYYVVLIPDDETNPFRTRTDAKTTSKTLVNDKDDLELTENYETNLKTFYERYKQAGIIDSYKFMDTREFNNFVLEIFSSEN